MSISLTHKKPLIEAAFYLAETLAYVAAASSDLGFQGQFVIEQIRDQAWDECTCSTGQNLGQATDDCTSAEINQLVTWSDVGRNEFFHRVDVNGFVHDIDVVLAEQFQMLRRRVRCHDARRDVVVEFFAQLLNEIKAISFAQAEVAQNEIQLGQQGKTLLKSPVFIRQEVNTVAGLGEVLLIGLQERLIVFKDAQMAA